MRQKFTRQERKDIKHQQVQSAMSGNGLYIYENSSDKADLTLPRPTKTGVRSVPPKGRFQGDDYYMQLVRTGFLRCIESLQTPEAENEVKMLEEQKLILDQPEKVTPKGVVEHVVEKNVSKQKLNEDKKSVDNTPVLLNEAPGSDGFVVITE
jgi:hypothetical protein